MQHIEREVTTSTNLCNEKGLLNPEAIGYATSPVIRGNLKGRWPQKKRWNRWVVYGEDVFLSVMLSHLDYAAVIHVSFYDLETGRSVDERYVFPMNRQLHLSEYVFDSTSFHHEQLSIQTTYLESATTVTLNIPQFDNETLRVSLTMTHRKDDQSVNVVVPHKRKEFQLTSKHMTLPTEGSITLENRHYTLAPQYSFSTFDFTRGVWSRDVDRYWANASQQVGGRRIGLNLGGKWTDGTGMTENGFMIDGQLRKFHEDVLFVHDNTDVTRPWAIRTKFSKNLQMSFTPFTYKKTTFPLVVGHVEKHRYLGYFNGVTTLEDGQPLRIRQLLGIVEQTKGKW